MGDYRIRAQKIKGVDLKITVIDEGHKTSECTVFTPKFRQDNTPDQSTGIYITDALNKHKEGKRVIIEPVDTERVKQKRALELVKRHPHLEENLSVSCEL